MSAMSIKAKVKSWRNAIIGTLSAAGVWLAAVVSTQPPVAPHPLPIAAHGASEWVFTNAYSITVDGITLTIPSGFVCDLASIPNQAQSALGIDRDHPTIRRAAAVHDWLYKSKVVPRERADNILLVLCLADGMDKDKAQAVYEAVRLWGFIAWER